jgi:hypothetical protein
MKMLSTIQAMSEQTSTTSPQHADSALTNLYARHGVTLRKHINEVHGWDDRVPTVVDLNTEEKELLASEGENALDRELRSKGCFPFPSLTIRTLKPMHLRTDLVRSGRPAATIFVPKGRHYLTIARELAREIQNRCGVVLPVKGEAAFTEDFLRVSNVVLLGGAHENQGSRIMADRFYAVADLNVPGSDGWLVHTFHNPLGLGGNVIQLSAGRGTQRSALEYLFANLRSDSAGLYVERLCRTQLGAALTRVLGSRQSRLEALGIKGAPTPKLIDAYVRRTCKGFDSGGKENDRYNLVPLYVAATMARTYVLTSEREYLQIFKGVLWACLRYHTQTFGGASYISDVDFMVSDLLVWWDLLEEEDIFDDAERLILTNFLMSLAEMIHRYKEQFWPTSPGKQRHNHETFSSLSLYFCGRYFGNYYGLPMAENWKAIAACCFSGPIETSFKFKEDANLYQWLAPAHKLIYDRAMGTDRYLKSGNMRIVAKNISITTDNFGYPCDFGDAGAPISGGGLGAALVEIAAGHHKDAEMQGLSDRIRAALPRPADRLGPVHLLPFGCGRIKGKRPESKPIEIMPLDDHIRLRAQSVLPKRFVYDKAAFRVSLDPKDQYLLLDGYSFDSHCHYDQNAVIRFCQHNRMWIVDNGYGKPAGAKGCANQFHKRQRGPEQHNTLLFHDATGRLLLPPPLCVRIGQHESKREVVFQSALLNYGGNDWLRTLYWIKGIAFLVVDQVNVGAPLQKLTCQWNMLGEVEPADGYQHVRQQGANMFLHWAKSDASAVQRSTYINASLEAEIAAGFYPYANATVKQLNLVCGSPVPGSHHTFVSLFYSTTASYPGLALQPNGAGVIISGRLLPRSRENIVLNGFKTEAKGNAIAVTWREPWLRPIALKRPAIKASTSKRSVQ